MELPSRCLSVWVGHAVVCVRSPLPFGSVNVATSQSNLQVGQKLVWVLYFYGMLELAEQSR